MMDGLYVAVFDRPDVELYDVGRPGIMIRGKIELHPMPVLNEEGYVIREPEPAYGMEGLGYVVSDVVIEGFLNVLGVMSMQGASGKSCFVVVRGGVVHELWSLRANGYRLNLRKGADE
jgi:hypothetical protein